MRFQAQSDGPWSAAEDVHRERRAHTRCTFEEVGPDALVLQESGSLVSHPSLFQRSAC